MGKFAGFVAKGDTFIFTVVTGSALHVAAAPDAAPTFDVYQVTAGALAAVSSSNNSVPVGSVTGFYAGSIATTSMTAGSRYYVKVNYEISSTEYTEDLVFQVV